MFNCQSIIPKITELSSIVASINPDVFVGTETWLSTSVSSSEILPPGYVAYQKDRNSHDGSVLIAHKNSLNSHQIIVDSSCEIIACQIELCTFICAIYRQPNSDSDYLNNLCVTLEQIYLSNTSATIWITRDINLPDIDRELNTIASHQNPHSLNKCLLDFLADCYLTQLVNFPTHQTNTLDIFATNKPVLVSGCQPISGISGI